MTRENIRPGQIRCVAFDAVGTLIHPHPPVAAVYHAVAARSGSRLSLSEIRSRFQQVFARLETDECLSCSCPQSAQVFHTCEEREHNRWQRIVESVLDDIEFPDDCFAELFAHFGRSSSWQCFDDVEPALRALQDARVSLAVCSNFDARLHPVLNGLDSLRGIETRIVSSLVGHRKPSPDFFEALLQATGCRPSEVLFVGDDLRNDVLAAASVGMASLQIDRSESPGDNRRIRSLSEISGLFKA